MIYRARTLTGRLNWVLIIHLCLIISDSVIAVSSDTPSIRVETRHYTKVMFLFINSIQQSWNFLLQSGASHELCLCLTKRPLNNKPCYLVPAFDSSLLCRMLWWWFSPTRHLWQILQLGATLFNLSIKTDFFWVFDSGR